MKTTSTEGLILHIRGKQNGAHVTLYMTSGKIRLMVGNRSIHYHKKINDNHWHKVCMVFQWVEEVKVRSCSLRHTG